MDHLSARPYPHHALAARWLDLSEIMLLAADLLDGSARRWDEERTRQAKTRLDGLLATAGRCGFPHADLLRGALRKRQLDPGSFALLMAAVGAAGASGATAAMLH